MFRKVLPRAVEGFRIYVDLRFGGTTCDRPGGVSSNFLVTDMKHCSSTAAMLPEGADERDTGRERAFTATAVERQGDEMDW